MRALRRYVGTSYLLVAVKGWANKKTASTTAKIQVNRKSSPDRALLRDSMCVYESRNYTGGSKSIL